MISRTVGSASSLSAHHGELLAIREACKLVDNLWPDQGTDPRMAVTIFSDSQSAPPGTGKTTTTEWTSDSTGHLMATPAIYAAVSTTDRVSVGPWTRGHSRQRTGS